MRRNLPYDALSERLDERPKLGEVDVGRLLPILHAHKVRDHRQRQVGVIPYSQLIEGGGDEVNGQQARAVLIEPSEDAPNRLDRLRGRRRRLRRRGWRSGWRRAWRLWRWLVLRWRGLPR